MMAPARSSLENSLRTAKINGAIQRARPPFAVGWCISGSRDIHEQWANAPSEELSSLGEFYAGLEVWQKQTLASQARWALRATIEASLEPSDTRDALLSVCLELSNVLQGSFMTDMLATGVRQDLFNPPNNLACGWPPVLRHGALATLTALFDDYMPSIRSVPAVANVPVAIVSWAIQVCCAHVHHASINGFNLGQCCVCFDAVANSAMSSCLHNMFCSDCLVSAARSHQARSNNNSTSTSDKQHLLENIWFPCPVCRKIGRVL